MLFYNLIPKGEAASPFGTPLKGSPLSQRYALPALP